MENMAHGGNSCLQSLSSDSRTLRVPLDLERNVAQHIETLIENKEYTNPVESQEAPSPETNFNSNISDLPWHDEGQPAGQKELLCRDGAHSDFATSKMANAGSSSLLETDLNLHDVDYVCDMLNPSLIEEYSKVSSCEEAVVDSIKPTCIELHNESNHHTVTRGMNCIRNELSTMENEQNTDLKDAHERMDGKGNDVPSSVVPSYYQLESKENKKDYLNETEQEVEDCVMKIEEPQMKVQLPGTLAAALGSLCASECEREENKPNTPQGSKQEEDKCVVHGKCTLSGATETLSASKKQEEDNMEKSTIVKHVSDSILSQSVSENRRAVDDVIDEQELVRAEMADDKHLNMPYSSPVILTTFENTAEDITNGNVLGDKKVACSKQGDQSSNVSFIGYNKDSVVKGFLEKEVMSSPTQGPLNSENIKISDCQDSDRELNDSIKYTCVGLHNSDSESKQDHDLVSPIEEMTTSSFLKADQTLQKPYMHNTEALNLLKGGVENARVPFQEECFEDDLEIPLSTFYGEPLSREDSVSETESKCEALSESNHQIRRDYITINEMRREDKKDLVDPVPQVKSSLHMLKGMQPIVLLKTLERRKINAVDEFYCAECQHAALNVDHIIEHHHSNHSHYKFQFCESCDTYLTNGEPTQKHFCRIDETQSTSSNASKQMRALTLPGKYKCRYCIKMFPTLEGLNQHKWSHLHQTQFKCHRCGHCFAQKGGLTRHKRIVKCRSSHSQIQKMVNKSVTAQVFPTQPLGNLTDCFVKLVDVCKTHICSICSKSFTTRENLKNHKYDLHNKICKTSLSQAIGGQKQIPIETETSAKYKCPLCPRIFKYSYNRARHLREQCIRDFTSHESGKVGLKFQCPLCPAIFSHLSNRRRHLKTKCLKNYNREHLRENSEHEEKVQQKEKQAAPSIMASHPFKSFFQCNVCPAIFGHNSGLFRHKKKHELFKITGKAFKYRRSLLTHPSRDSVTATEESRLPICCHLCGKCFNTSYSLNKHVHKHKDVERPYSCQECGKCFFRKDHLFSHKKVHQRRIQCTVCKKILPTITELIQHRQSHIKKGVLQCPDCPRQFQYPALLVRHVATHKHKVKQSLKLKEYVEDQKKTKCPLCNVFFRSVKELIFHCLQHSTGPNSRQCPFCKRHFTQRQSMRRHMSMHILEKRFFCQNCKKGFHRKEYMLVHQERCLGPKDKYKANVSKETQAKPATECKGTPPKMFLNESKANTARQKTTKCSYCPREFNRVTRLIQHHKSHKLNMLIPCPKCKQFIGKNKFKAHGDKCKSILFLCKGCGKGFSRQCNRVIHEKTCNSVNVSQSMTKKAAGMGRDPFPLKCSQCPSKYKYRSHLLRHLQTHTRKTYACMYCGQKYTHQSRYLQHEAFCDGVNKQMSSRLSSLMHPISSFKAAKLQSQADIEGQYKCKFCTKTFIKPQSLRRHILTHTEVKPYRCKACDSCFSRHDHLKLHQTRCNGKRQRLELCIAKVSLDDVGKGWQKLGKAQQNVFHCSSCSRSFSSQSNLRRHMSMSHVSKKPFSCIHCGNSFTLEKTLKRHRLYSKCSMVSSQKRYLQLTSEKHGSITEFPRNKSNDIESFRQPSTKKKKIICKYCPRTFKHTEQLKVHTRLHTGEKPFGCANCSERFIRRDYLKRHLIKCKLNDEHSDTVLCEWCGGVFSIMKLKNHQKSCTVKSAPTRPSSSESTTKSQPVQGFSCANCHARFLLFSQLQLHFLTKHRNETNLKTQMQAPPLHVQLSNMIKEEPFDDGYEDINHSTDDNFSLESAESDDETDKPYSCTQCNMQFVNKGGLSRHMLTHSGQHPFNCKRCKKGFWNQNHHRRHVRKCSKLLSNFKEERITDTFVTEMGSPQNVLVFNQGSKTTGTGVLQTNFSCKDDFKATTQDISTRNQRKESSTDRSKSVQYQCSECDQSFTDGLLLISHLEDHGREDQKQKLSTCQRCGKKCSNPGNLERHMKVHVNEETYSCPECPKTFQFHSELDIHRSYHDPNRPYSCIQCKQRFWTSQSLGKHYNECHPTNIYTCQFCQKRYSVRSSLVRHCRVRHTFNLNQDVKFPIEQTETTSQGLGIQVNKIDESDSDNEEETSNENESSGDNDSDTAPYFPCHVCGKTFLTSESLEDHQRCHLGEKPHECAECGKCFFQAAQLQQHQRSHKSEFQCQTCGRGFVSLFALRNHKHTHGKSRPYRCPKCLLSFTGPSQLAEHIATHRDDNFPCDICDKTFSCKISRAEHRKVHIEPEGVVFSVNSPEENSSPPVSSSEIADMKYRCGVCNESFKEPEQLSEHGCTAGRDRSYPCLPCSKHFLQESHLKKHQLTEHPSQPYMYQCNECHISFTYRNHYHNHLKKHCSGVTTDIHVSSKDFETVTDKIFKCPICPLSFDQAMELSSHLSVHSENSHKCRTCKLSYPSKSKLAEHERCHLTAATQYECTRCAQNFLGSDAFRQHHCSRQQRADKDSELPCPSTSKSSVNQPIEEEEVDVGEDFINCVDCPKRFSSKLVLLEHVKKHHPSDMFKCELCVKTFHKRKYLIKHQHRHQMKMDNVLHKESQLKCSICPKAFNSAQDLQLHMRMHAEKSGGAHRCDMCYKSFAQLSMLRQHQESHIGQVVYECTECDKAFAFPHLLEEHQKTHTVPNM